MRGKKPKIFRLRWARPGIDRDPGFNPVSRDPEPFYPDPDPSRFQFKIPDFSGFYKNFKISNLHSLHIIYLPEHVPIERKL